MISDDLRLLIKQNFEHIPTNEQEKVLELWCSFLLSRDSDSIFLLRGYAGTGKTSLVGAFVRTLNLLKQRFVLLAPTGRAAKVMSEYSGFEASTIHRCIYRQKTFGEELFTTAPNMQTDTIYIIDEASMIANEGLSGSIFGDGRLLDDLIHYVYSSPGCRIIMVGDTAQLPPVGETVSPALSQECLAGYGLNVTEAILTEVVRQASESGILWNATRLRQILQNGSMEMPRFDISLPEVSVVPGNELIEQLENSYYHCGKDMVIVVTRSNKRAILYNQGIRARIFGYEEELGGGDRIMVAKNKYYKRNIGDGKWEADLIANGEMATIKRLRNHRELYGFHFADATIVLNEHDTGGGDGSSGREGRESEESLECMEMDCVLLLDTLHSEASALTREQQEHLFYSVCADYPELHNKRDLYKAVKEDPHYGALQIKYAYAITCHKAQGGQWEDVYIDQGYMTEEMLGEDYIRWLYTAITRATGHVYLVNWPDEQIL